MSADELRSWYREAVRDAFEEGAATLEEAVKQAEARRRIVVDSQGGAVVAYVEPDGEEETP